MDGLARGIHGTVIQPGDPRYDEARLVWNGMIDKRPAAIVQCVDPDDVARTIAFAKTNDILLAVRGGGHNVAGFGTCDGGLVLDLSPMKEVRVDVGARTARAQGGATWGAFDEATQAHGLATTGGLVSTTGVAGLTLGGGVGWLMRKHGLTIDNLRAVDLVAADGRRIHASPDENPDLFWGVRGGGGNFGVVTSFEYDLHPVGPTVFGGAVAHPIDRAGEVLRFYREWAPTLPDEMTTLVAFMTAPPLPWVPADVVGRIVVAVALCHAGRVDEGERLARPLKALSNPSIDLLGPHPYLGLQQMFDPAAPRGIWAYWKTEYLEELDDGVIGMLSEHAGRMRSAFSAVHIHHLEGAVERVPEADAAFAHRSSRYILNIVSMWMEPSEADQHVAWARTFWDAIRPSATGGAYLNFLGDEGQDRIKAAYGDAKYARLVELKKKYDPTNLFRVNQNIQPAS